MVGAHRRQFRGDDLEMPAQRERVRGLSSWNECLAKLAKSARSSGLLQCHDVIDRHVGGIQGRARVAWAGSKRMRMRSEP